MPRVHCAAVATLRSSPHGHRGPPFCGARRADFVYRVAWTLLSPNAAPVGSALPLAVGALSAFALSATALSLTRDVCIARSTGSVAVPVASSLACRFLDC